MRVANVAFTLALIIPLVGCRHYSENGNLGFELDIADWLYEFESGDRVLAGTHMCPQFVAARFGDDEGYYEIGPSNEHCFSETLTKPVQFDAEHCLTLDIPGQVIWELMPTHLDGCDPQYVGDIMVFNVVAASDDLRLGFDDWRVRSPIADVFADSAIALVGLSPEKTLADLREESGAERRVVAGQLDAPMLRLDDDIGRIYFVDADVAFELVGQGATPIEPVDSDEPWAEWRIPGERPLVLEPGALAYVRATLPGGVVLESPELIAVPPSDADSLDLIVVLEEGTPLFAYAEVRDAQDRVLHAAPIEWSVSEGALAVVPGALRTDTRTGEYASLGNGCEPPSSNEPLERHAVLRARLGTLEDSVELNWIEEPDPSGEPFEPDEWCMFGEDVNGDDDGNDESGNASHDRNGDDAGCACSTDPETPIGGLAWLALAVLPFVRRGGSHGSERPCSARRGS